MVGVLSQRVRPSPETRPTRRRAQTRARLLDAAFEVFAAKGFGAATIEDVCSAAGFTRGAFYSNFGSMDELFYALYERNAEQIGNQVTEALATPAGSLEEAIRRAVGALHLSREWSLVRGDFVRYAARNPAVAAEWERRQEGLREVLAARLAPAAARANLPESMRRPQDLARAAMVMYHGTMDAVLIEWDAEQARRWLTALLCAVLGAHPPD